MVKSAPESSVTVALAFAVNAAVAVAKTVAAAITGSASMLAESAHSWADTGNEVLLLVAERRSARTPEADDPLGYGREAYIWSMFAALGLLGLGAGVSISHGVGELLDPEDSSDFLVAYIVLALSFVLEGTSFRQTIRQLRVEAKQFDRTLLEHAIQTSDPTTRAVFAEDGAALIGLTIAFVGVLMHQLTGSPAWDSIGSILVGILLAGVAVVLINQNRRYLVGVEASPPLRSAIVESLVAMPEVDRVTFLRTEYLGPKRLYLVARVDVSGDDVESIVATKLQAITARLESTRYIARAVVGLSTPDQPSITA